MTLLPTDDDGKSSLQSGCRITHPNDCDTNPPPPNESKFGLNQPPTDNDRDTNPPPPIKPEFNLNQPSTGKSQLSQSLLSNDADAFTVISRTHEGHSTNSPRNAMVTAFAPDAVPFHNTFGPLADGDASSVEDSGVQPHKIPHDHDSVDAPTQRIDELFRTADATLAVATFNFNLVKERLQIRLERDLTQTIATKTESSGADLKQSFGESISTFFTNIRQNVDNSTSTHTRYIQCMDDRLAQMSGSLQQHNSSFTAAIRIISANTAKLAQETSALSVRVVEHQSHLEHLRV
jgi:hypothetical protein